MSDEGKTHGGHHPDRDHARFDKRKNLREAWTHREQNPAVELENPTLRRKLAKRQSRERSSR